MKRGTPSLGVWSKPSGEDRFLIDPQSWKQGPTNPAGDLFDLSDRPILCGAINESGTECTLGSGDHALYTLDLEKRSITRKLYARDGGHSEWVTSVAYMAQGKILSGGMDGHLCLWGASSPSGNRPAVRCSASLVGSKPCAQEMNAHKGSISCIKVDSGGHALTAGYSTQGEVKVWSTKFGALKCLCELYQCSKKFTPVMDLAWHATEVVAGHRNGSCQLWDLTRGTLDNHWKAHQGHVTCVDFLLDANQLVSGGQDGCINVWDVRSNPKLPVLSYNSHSCSAGAGSVGGLSVDNYRIISYGADKCISIVDIRMNGRVAFRLKDHTDFIYSMCIIKGENEGSGLLWTGSGSGMVLCHDLLNLNLLYGLGTTQGAVRCLNVSQRNLVASGDDGNCLLYEGEQQ